MKITEWVYDPENAPMSYGHFRCLACGQCFYGGGPPIHVSSCRFFRRPFGSEEPADTPYAYHFGDKEVENLLERGRPGLGNLTRDVLEQQFRHLLK